MGICRNVLYSSDGGVLKNGESLYNGSNRLTMQKDGNLVLYRSENPIWASKTHGNGDGCFLKLTTEGALHVTKGSSKLWTSGSNNVKGNYVLILQDDGNCVVYGTSVWATNTHTHTNTN